MIFAQNLEIPASVPRRQCAEMAKQRQKIDRDKYIVEKVNFGVLCRTVHRPWFQQHSKDKYSVGSYGEKTEFFSGTSRITSILVHTT